MLLPGKCHCENMLLGAGDDTDQTQALEPWVRMKPPARDTLAVTEGRLCDGNILGLLISVPQY